MRYFLLTEFRTFWEPVDNWDSSSTNSIFFGVLNETTRNKNNSYFTLFQFTTFAVRNSVFYQLNPLCFVNLLTTAVPVFLLILKQNYARDLCIPSIVGGTVVRGVETASVLFRNSLETEATAVGADEGTGLEALGAAVVDTATAPRTTFVAMGFNTESEGETDRVTTLPFSRGLDAATDDLLAEIGDIVELEAAEANETSVPRLDVGRELEILASDRDKNAEEDGSAVLVTVGRWSDEIGFALEAGRIGVLMSDACDPSVEREF